MSMATKLELPGIKIETDVVIKKHDYSMEVEIGINVYARLCLVPHHTIQLGKSSCPPSLPSLKSQTCASLYKIATRTDPPLSCDVDKSCSSMSCVLTLEARYIMLIESLLCAENSTLLLTVSVEGGEKLFSGSKFDASKFEINLSKESNKTILYFDVDVFGFNARLSVSKLLYISLEYIIHL